jgi:hypothetical protein
MPKKGENSVELARRAVIPPNRALSIHNDSHPEERTYYFSHHPVRGTLFPQFQQAREIIVLSEPCWRISQQSHRWL